MLLHGATSSWRAWRPVLPALEAHHRVFAPTLAGHLSGTPIATEPARIVPSIVDDAERAMDQVGMADAHLVGNSLGGWIALELARRGRARSVVALSPAGAWRCPRDLARLLLVFRSAAAFGRHPLTRGLLRSAVFRRLALRGIARYPERMSAADVDDMLDDLAGCTILPDLLQGARANGAIRSLRTGCPMMLAWGTEDRLLPFARYGRPMAESVPGAVVVRLPGVGHVPMADDPDMVARIVLDFIAGTGSDVSPGRRSA
ncbi:alpha/beta fold hydrolase [Pseudonocardia sp. Ae707_Ps1]|uniref:alpha/beta fold hydrolase n=1 Tax=Pseudonocardia sp. Ae707_Ps1 TaxID=1885572 RepID=UPI0003102DE5|nr:alpha/beta fold hydrolase [Pseudonocardia sp. Ae707_Ps1]